MPIHLNVNGSWQEGNMVYVRVAGSWVEADELFVRQEGAWTSAWKNEVIYVNTADRTGASIFELMGSPTQPSTYIFENNATISAGTGSFALRTGTFPAGSTLVIINKGYIRGRGGSAGAHKAASGAGGTALYLDYPCTLDNSQGYIFGGGGGGAWHERTYHGTQGPHSWGWGVAGGGGGAGSNAGAGSGSARSDYVSVVSHGSAGTISSGGARGSIRHTDGGMAYGGAGGGLGAAGGYGSGSFYSARNGTAGAAGAAIARNGIALSITAGNDTNRIKGAIA